MAVRFGVARLLPLVVVALVWPVSAATAAQRARDAGAGAAAVPGELIVGFEPGTPADERAAARRQAGARVRRGLRLAGAQLLTARDPERAIRTLRRHPRVLYAQPNRIRRAATHIQPGDTHLWGLDNTGQAPFGGVPDADIDAPEAWDLTTGSPAVVVAVVDEGVDYTHPELFTGMWDGPGSSVGHDWVDDDEDPMDEGGHGTHVAGTIAARADGSGVVGVSPFSRIMALRVLGPDGGEDADIAEAFDYAADHGARVVNASLGGPGESPVVEAAVAANPDVLYVVAAGNEEIDTDTEPGGSFPCNIPRENLVCVAATTPDDSLAGFSNFGAVSVDLGAPGEDIKSTVPWIFNDGFFDLSSWLNPSGQWSAPSRFLTLGDDGYAPGPGPGAALTQTAAMDLAGRTGCELSYLASHNLGPGDAVLVKRVVGPSDEVTLREHTGEVPSWDLLDWDEHAVPLQADGASQVKIRFVLQGSTRGAGFGFEADDVVVRCDPPGGAGFAFQDGTSMAAPHVSGVAALLLAHRPGESVVTMRQALLAGGDPTPSLAATTASGRRLNAAGALAMLSWPAASAAEASAVTHSSARLEGVVDPNGAATTYHVEYGTTTGYGSQTQVESAGAGANPVNAEADLTGLQPSTTYHYRLVAVAGDRRSDGPDGFFTTLAAPAPTPTPTPPPVTDPQPVLGANAKLRCRARRSSSSRRRIARCKASADAAVRVRIVLKRRGRRIAKRTGATGRYLKLRGRSVRRARYKVVLTFFDGDGRRATVKRRRRI